MSVAGLQELDQSPGQTIVDVDRVDACGDQPRTVFEETALAELAASIRAIGVVQPLVVRKKEDGRYEIVSGERRWRAAKAAGLTVLPAVVRDLDDDEAFCQSTVENVVRESLTPMDEVRAVCRVATKFGVQDAARRLGKPHSWVSKRKRIAEAPGFILDFLAAGASTDIEAHYALAQLADRDPEIAKEVIENHSDGQLREEVKAAARALSAGTGEDALRSHANGESEEEDFRIESRESAAAEADDDSSDPDYDAAGDDGEEDAPEKPWRPSDAPELESPFDADVAVLVTSAVGRRAGLVALTTSNGTTTYEFTAEARSQLRALLGTGGAP